MSKKSDSSDDLMCSFCGKSQDEVKKLIAGPSVYICDECIQLCNEIIAEEYTQESEEDSSSDLLKPADIKETLDQYVIEQEKPKKNPVCGGSQPLQEDKHKGRYGRRGDREKQYPPDWPHRVRQDTSRTDPGQNPKSPFHDC